MWLQQKRGPGWGQVDGREEVTFEWSLLGEGEGPHGKVSGVWPVILDPSDAPSKENGVCTCREE